MLKENLFAERVKYVVSQIPAGRVMTYGQIAGICGNAQAARIVGGIAHYGEVGLPWHRVVNKQGGLAAGYHGGRKAHKLVLESEGVEVFGQEDNFYIKIDELLWNPKI